MSNKEITDIENVFLISKEEAYINGSYFNSMGEFDESHEREEKVEDESPSEAEKNGQF